MIYSELAQIGLIMFDSHYGGKCTLSADNIKGVTISDSGQVFVSTSEVTPEGETASYRVKVDEDTEAQIVYDELIGAWSTAQQSALSFSKMFLVSVEMKAVIDSAQIELHAMLAENARRALDNEYPSYSEQEIRAIASDTAEKLDELRCQL